MTEWAERAADRAPAVSERRSKAVEHTSNIVAAARRLIVTRVEPFTIQDLVREAGIGLPTFYRHFGSKDELLLAVIGDLIGDACDEYERQAQAFDDPLDRLQSYISS